MLKNVVPRLYQETIFANCCNKNSIVVLPTGLGKTLISLMLAVHRIKLFPQSKILVVAPTKPLAEQHHRVFQEHLEAPEEKFALLTGAINSEKREGLYKNGVFLFATPQTIENDVLNGIFPISEISLLVVDEAHRTVGEYSYVFLAKEFYKKAKFPRVLALTASPGDSIETIKEVCENLKIENIEVKTTEDPDVKQYVQELKIEWTKVELPEEFSSIRKNLQNFISSRITELKKNGIITRTNMSRMDVLKFQASIQGRIAGGDRNPAVYKSISILAEILKIMHALEVIESQGLEQAVTYLEKLEGEGIISKSKASKNIMLDADFRRALQRSRELIEEKVIHPKLAKLKEIVQSEKGKIIIFTALRDSATAIQKYIGEGEIFIGQSKKNGNGLSQKDQIELLEKFRNDECRILICTSVGEEGLDVPAVNLVVFYESVPSAIRAIQRKGRTARSGAGRVIMLYTKGTRDEAMHHASRRKEERMKRLLLSLKSSLHPKIEEQSKIKEFTGIKITADYREKKSRVVQKLLDEGIQVALETLPTGDYSLSPRVGVELKTVQDFVNSLLDGRLLEQLKNFKNFYSRPIIILEGREDIYTSRNVHPNAIRGAITTITVSYGIPIIFSRSPEESAEFIKTIARREHENSTEKYITKVYNSHKTKGNKVSEQQEYIISALPNIGRNTAQNMLKQFKKIERIATATEEELKKVEGVGETTAKNIKEIFEKEYEE